MPGQCDSRSICDVRRLIATELLCRCDDIDLLVDWVGRAAVQPSAWSIGGLCGYARGSGLIAMVSMRPTSPWRRGEGAKEARCRALHIVCVECGVWRSMGPNSRSSKAICSSDKSVVST